MPIMPRRPVDQRVADLERRIADLERVVADLVRRQT